MGSVVWELSPDYPGGRARPMSLVEQAQYDVDQVAGAAAAVVQQTSRANQVALAAALAARMTSLRQARSAIAGGSLFASLSAAEKKVMDALLQNDLQFARLTLELLDATDA